jgi:hypothetical protein
VEKWFPQACKEVELRQRDGLRKWLDLHIKQELDEEGKTYADWIGGQYSPFTPVWKQFV